MVQRDQIPLEVNDLELYLLYLNALEDSPLGGGRDNDNEIDVSVVTEFERNSMYNGKLFTAGSLVRDIEDGASTFFFLENPSDSTALIDIESLIIRTNAKAILTITDSPTVDVAGTPAKIRNKRSSFSNTSEANITVGGEYSGGIEEEDILIPAGEGDQRIGGETGDRLALVDIGDSLLIEVFNDSGRTSDQEIKFKYSEVEP